MLTIKYHPGGMHLNGPAFEAFASKVVLPDGQEVVVLANTADVAVGVATVLADNATQAAHVLLGQPPWYLNSTKENTLEDILPQVEVGPGAAVPRLGSSQPAVKPPEAPPRRRGLFDV